MNILDLTTWDNNPLFFRPSTHTEAMSKRDQRSEIWAQMKAWEDAGNEVKVLPPMTLSHYDSYAEMNKAQKERLAEINARISKAQEHEKRASDARFELAGVA